MWYVISCVVRTSRGFPSALAISSSTRQLGFGYLRGAGHSLGHELSCNLNASACSECPGSVNVKNVATQHEDEALPFNSW